MQILIQGILGGAWGLAFLMSSWVGAAAAAAAAGLRTSLWAVKFWRICATSMHVNREIPQLTLTEPSQSAHCLGVDGGLSRTGGNHSYLHLQKQGVGSFAQCDRKLWRGSSCCLWLSRWSGRRVSLIERKQRHLESQMLSPDQIPSTVWWNPAVASSHPGLWHLASLLMHFSLCSWKNWTHKLNPPSGSLTCVASTYSAVNHQPH